eukprot:TRINITY_DN1778_c0_g1_i3.p1 TRINITY_DN1778_c0_g1~~TRINITY_DN1778_c0_g1_i3.p1  ORF type:complete len:642 (+),score=189.64 TRINITY_DN1778_c0_g1_i3:1797-3722(+)
MQRYVDSQHVFSAIHDHKLNQTNHEMKATPLEKLELARKYMKKNRVNAFIVPTQDPHNCEYVPENDKLRQYISGFTGSAGTAVITETKAALFTDGRYWLQAENQLDLNLWQVIRTGSPNAPSITDFLIATHFEEAEENTTYFVGIDAFRMTLQERDRMAAVFYEQETIAFNEDCESIVMAVRKELEEEQTVETEVVQQAFVQPIEFTGLSVQEKLDMVRNKVLCDGISTAFIVSALDEIAWLLNIRGRDVMYNPVCISYLIITKDSAIWFVNKDKLSNQVRSQLDDLVDYKDYESILDEVSDMSSVEGGHTFAVDPTINVAIALALQSQVSVKSPVPLAKALKTEQELEGMRQCHIRDGVALCKYLCWLESEIAKGQVLTECTAADHLEALRSKNDMFQGLSFPSISSSGANGAIIHYVPEEETCAEIDPNALYLIDSGGQYTDGTTDVTRTVCFHDPTDHERRCFTRVLQGHIALATIRFPKGTSGDKLDAFARMPLWQDGLDYRHGTGHGVGSFLNVHEGPQGIHLRPHPVSMLPSMTMTNEPGFYEAGAFGIRIENVMICERVNTLHEFERTEFYGFETITCAPIQKKLIDVSLLSNKEIQWVNDYHGFVWEKLEPLVQDDEEVYNWLKEATSPLDSQ